MGIVSFLGRIGSMIAPFTATVVRFLCLSVYIKRSNISCSPATCIHTFGGVPKNRRVSGMCKKVILLCNGNNVQVQVRGVLSISVSL